MRCGGCWRDKRECVDVARSLDAEPPGAEPLREFAASFAEKHRSGPRRSGTAISRHKSWNCRRVGPHPRDYVPECARTIRGTWKYVLRGNTLRGAALLVFGPRNRDRRSTDD